MDEAQLRGSHLGFKDLGFRGLGFLRGVFRVLEFYGSGFRV